MAAELSVRSAYRGQVTKLVKGASDFLNSMNVKSDSIDAYDQFEEELANLIRRLTTAHESLSIVNQEIQKKQLLAPEELDRELEKVIEYEDAAVGMIARLETRLHKLRRNHSTVETNSPSSGLRTTNTSMKLPKLELKRFDGNYRDWLPFWEQFRATIHENSNLTAADKFGYLESVLIGSAKKAISGFTASGMCYESAVSLLQEQYGNMERLVDRNMQQLLSLRPVTSRNDVASLRDLYNSVTACCRTLTSLQIPDHQYNVMLKSILLRCLPAELRVDYYRSNEEERETPEVAEKDGKNCSSTLSNIGDKQVRGIMRFLKKEVESLELSKACSLSSNVNVKYASPTPTTAASLISSGGTSPCVFCSSDRHTTKNCDSEMSIFEKRDVLRKTGRCFRCANRGHSSKKCRSSKWLSCEKCKGRHLTSLCDPSFTKNTPVPKSIPNQEQHKSATNLCAHNICTENKNVFIKTAWCIAAAPSGNQEIGVRLVIDGGSQFSFIREDLARRLRLPSTGDMSISVLPFGCKEQSPFKKFKTVEVQLRSQYTSESVVLEAIEVPQICIDILPAPDTSCTSFGNLHLADSRICNVNAQEGLSVLIGSDHYWSVVTGKQKHISTSLRAVETIFGWTVQGMHRSGKNLPVNDISCSSFACSAILHSSAPIKDDLTAFWSLESIGIRSEQAENEQLADELTKKCISRNGTRYMASLPWLDDEVVIRSNKESAAKRLNSLTTRLLRDPVQFKQYDAGIRQLVSDGVAEPITVSTKVEPGRIFYLPHRAVYKDSTTTKQRIVFDASARSDDNPSLNDMLHVGANLLPDVLKVLLNFRLGRFGAIADIEKAFLQILLHEKDRDSHRFLWYEPSKTPLTEKSKIVEYRMTRVTFGVSSSPFLLTATLRTHLSASKEYPVTCNILLDSFYMDDLVISFEDEEVGKRTCEEAVLVLKDACMNLRKWNSSSSVVRKALCPGECLSMQKVLGVAWFVRTDELAVVMNSIEALATSKLLAGTKRKVLQTIARIYDPLGMLSPMVIRLKVLFQSIWKENLQWDQVLSPLLANEWQECVQDLLELKNYAIPRAALRFPSVSSVTIHIFSDASMRAYGAVAYVRAVDNDDKCTTAFLCAKNRVCPLKLDGSKELSLPKLELTAALLGARLCAYLKRSLKIKVHSFHLWTDSRIALGWIQGDTQRWKPYIQARVTEIRRHTSKTDWRHCSGKENPADLLTRGISAQSLQNSTVWTNGPAWLQSKVNCDVEMVDDRLGPVALLAQVNAIVQSPLEPFLDYRKYSSWIRLLHVTAYCYRFLHTKRESGVKSMCPSAEELERAECYWLKYIQSNYFQAEIECIKAKKMVPKNSKIVQWHPFLDGKGFLRLGGRLQLFDGSFDEKHPILLPAKSYLVCLIVDYYHQKTFHGGVNVVLTQLREQFWILKGRPLVKRRIKLCVTCQKLFGKPISQPFGPLPFDRLTLSKPFDCVGVDYAGPFYYIDATTKEMEKCYMMVFTCAAVRAVHLELCTSMSTASCMMGLRRFLARRGSPSIIYSDNAKTFRRAALELQATDLTLNDEQVQEFLSERKIRWKFIIERAPWWGGFWERLIRTIKNVLKVIIRRAKLNYEQLETIIAEAEFIVNARPLTYVCSDPLDSTALTPAHFIRGHGTVASPQDGITSTEMRKLWLQRLKYTRMLSNRWRVEYVQALRSHHSSQGHSSLQLKPNDVVLVFDPSKPRITGKMAVVEEALIGRDGKVRACMLRLADGSRMRRPVQLLYPLEVVNSCRAEDVEN